MGDRKGAFRVLVGRPEEKRLIRRPRRRWEDNIKSILKKWDGSMDWIDLTQYLER
jgi:hypothetical protein